MFGSFSGEPGRGKKGSTALRQRRPPALSALGVLSPNSRHFPQLCFTTVLSWPAIFFQGVLVDQGGL